MSQKPPHPQHTAELPLSDAWRALSALCVGFFMILLDQTIVAVATPHFHKDLDASLNDVIWVTSVYLLTFAVPLLVTGRLGDRFGQRTIYLIGMVVFTLSSLACGLASTIELLIIARALQGFGASLIAPQTMSVINRIFPRDKRGAAMGMWGAVAGFASLMGPLLGGVIVAYVGWQWIFFINVPIGVVSLVLVARWVPVLPRASRSIDALSVVASVISVFAFVFPLQEGPHLGWPLWLWGLLAAGVGAFAWFVWLQYTAARRGTEPLVPLVMFRNRNFALGSFSISAMGFVVGGTMVPIMLFLQDVQGMNAQQAAFMLIPMAVISGTLAPFVGRLADRIHPRVLSMIGFGFMTAAALALAAIMRDGVGRWWMLLPAVLLGFGNGFVWSPNSATSMRDLPIQSLGAASGVYNTTRQIGSVLGSAAIGGVMQMGVANSGYANSMGNSMVLCVIVLIFGLIAVSRFTERTDTAAAD